LGDEESKKFENLVFLSLLRKGFEPNKDIFYYSPNRGEVDFLIKKERKIISLFQACFNISDYQTKEREIKNLIKASKELKCNDLSVITSDYEAEEKISYSLAADKGKK
jgi:predicted AAA+ superfamily ATPase